MNRHEKVVFFEEILLIIPKNLLKWVVFVSLFRTVFEFLEGYARYHIEHNSKSLTVEDHTLKEPVFDDLVTELKGLIFINLLLCSAELVTFFFLITMLQVVHNMFDWSAGELYLHLNVQEPKNVYKNVSLL